MRLLLIRHGETDYNVSGMIQGQLDIPLNEKGIKQAERISKRVCDFNISHIFCSDLERAKRTAQIIIDQLKKKCPNQQFSLEYDERLRENCFGEWEGLTWEQVFKKMPQLLKSRDEFPNSFKAPSGTSLDELFDRVSEFFESLKPYITDKKDDSLLIISHNGPIKVIIALMENIPRNEFFHIKNVQNSKILEYILKK